jgi:hypothetical protein
VIDAKTWHQQLAAARDTTRDLVQSVTRDEWPRNGAIVDFGIDSQKHYEALYHPIREREIEPKELDEALGHGDKLSELARKAPSNPHKDVEFHTAWDEMLGRKPVRDRAKEDGWRDPWQKALEEFERDDEPEPER